MNDYNSAADCAPRPVPVEGRRLPAICDVAKKNAEIAHDINAGMNTLLELLTGPANEERCDVCKTPDCLLDDITAQANTLAEIHAKLSRAISALNG